MENRLSSTAQLRRLRPCTAVVKPRACCWHYTGEYDSINELTLSPGILNTHLSWWEGVALSMSPHATTTRARKKKRLPGTLSVRYHVHYTKQLQGHDYYAKLYHPPPSKSKATSNRQHYKTRGHHDTIPDFAAAAVVGSATIHASKNHT